MQLKNRNNYKNKRGQVLVEYVVVLVVVMAIVLMCILFFSVFSDYGINVRTQVGIDMP